ncbi:MAG TPA: glutamate formimidoyltransferase [Bryobacteraceae bacterium]|nr:glutamate formimidoyltransferase [Bryobacteraceae bacterium]
MIECVPNFSEGRDAAKVRAIVDAIASEPGVLILGWESDADHNRSVVTFAGEPEATLEGAIRGVGRASELIDLSAHRGVHPRVGAADVVPFVPLDGSTMEECIAIAHRAGEQIWRRFGVPVYFYESAARDENRRRLERVRRRGFDGKPPDIGDIASHPTAGAVMVAARGFLIAFNVNLSTPDAAAAQTIAARIRESSGGFRFVKAMGRYLASRDCAQISMNLTNFAETPLDQLYRTICEEAARLGTTVRSAQLVGFAPRRAFEMAPEFFRRAENFDESRIIETRIDTIKKSAGQY